MAILNLNLEKNIDYRDNIVIIEGVSHAQLGNYGEQNKQDIAVDALQNLLTNNN